ncbi:hypothetical protein G5V65_17425 [Rhodobacter sp. HX-7-19]|uniref:Uncharacterized protein n=1 Tax=Paragemmobacter kunshanensis TaxID=2583234 RepID=A0A6M1TYI2_9RHOB|nr:hypothetical protein [Rhodobacter kunshanensis]NGQ92677.1 hypothetical protein [Rhodobacter kunshanensis]
MKQALALVLASGTLGLAPDAEAGIAPPAAHAYVFADAAAGTPTRPLLVDDGSGDWALFWANGGGSDDGNGGGSDGGNGGDSDDDDCNLNDPACGAGNAAPAGTVAPPKNGLFTDGTAPVVKSN